MNADQKNQTIQVVQGSITSQEIDVIVNAANSSLLGGGGVDGAIHRAGGSSILHECRLLGGCNVGEAKHTTAGKLLAKRVIHTVGPKWIGGLNDEDEKLAACYENSLKLADELKLKSIVFPAISTGIYKFPKERAALIAVETVARVLPQTNIELVRFIFLYDDESAEHYLEACDKLGIVLDFA